MTDKAANRPVPRSYKGWLREKQGVEHFLNNLPPIVDDMGDKWRINTIKYYKSRLEHLKANAPPSPLNRKK